METSNNLATAIPTMVYDLGLQDYQTVWARMRNYTDRRQSDSPDQILIVEHPPVFTQGQAGKPEHILNNTDIPIIQSDRGGQVTYHGPGQVVIYTLFDLKRRNIGIRQLVSLLENAVIAYLAQQNISANLHKDAPGVYVADHKIASVGLRIRRGYSYHGLSFNVDMDLQPFSFINPCGYANLKMTQLADLVAEVDIAQVKLSLLNYIMG